MGLDIGFYASGEELLYLRNHDSFLDMFFDQSVEQVSPEYSDFHVDMRVLNGVAEDLRTELHDLGLSESDMPAEVPVNFWELDARATPWEVLLPVYPLLVRFLRRAVYERGRLACSWSS